MTIHATMYIRYCTLEISRWSHLRGEIAYKTLKPQVRVREVDRDLHWLKARTQRRHYVKVLIVSLVTVEV